MNLVVLNFTMLLLISTIHCQKELTLKYSTYAMEREVFPNEEYIKWNSKCYSMNKENGFIYHCDQLLHLTSSKELLSIICSKNAGEEELINVTSEILRSSSLVVRRLEVEHCPINYIGYYFNQDAIMLEEVHITCRNYNDSLTVSFPLYKLNKLQHLQILCPSWKELPRAMFYGKMTSLVTLHISRTQTENLNDGVFANFSNLRNLSLENNHIKSLKKSDFEGLISLKYLSIIEFHLHYIDNDIFQSVPNVKYLTIKKWNVSRLPDTFQMLNLTGLTISETSMIAIDAGECKNLINLTSLAITHNKILSINPDCFPYIKNVEVFRISGNKYSGFPKKMLMWEDLIEFHISDVVWDNCYEGRIISGGRLKLLIMKNISMHILNPYFISNITSMASFSSLTTLDLSDNYLQSLPVIPNELYIQNVILSNNRLPVIPENAFQAFSQAKEMHLDGNLLQEFAFQGRIFEYLKVLNLGSNFMNSTPYLIMENLIHLNLSNNKIDILDYRKIQCLRLTEIYLSGNHIKRSITTYKFSCLSIMDLSLNSIKYLPYVEHPITTLSLNGNNLNAFELYWACSMRQLQHLSLRECNITTITPYSKCPLEFPLKTLDLSWNHIQSSSWERDYDSVRKTVGRYSPFVVLRNLEELYLAYNEIEDIPMDMRNMMPKLRILDLRYNRIKYLLHHDLLYTSSLLFPDFIIIPYFQEKYLTVDLRHNQIRGVELPQQMLINNLTHKCDQHRYSHATLLLDNNPINCGCETIPLMKVIEGNMVLASEIWREDKRDVVLQAKIEPGNLKCRYPESVRGKKIVEPETWMHHLLPTIGFCHSVGFLGEEN